MCFIHSMTEGLSSLKSLQNLKSSVKVLDVKLSVRQKSLSGANI